MARDPRYKKFIIDDVILLLKGSFKDTFKAYFFGDPLSIPQNLLPCISVEKNSSENRLGPTGHDQVSTTLTIKVIYNKKDDFGKNTNESSLHRTMMEIVEGRDPETSDYKDTSVLGLLRRNLTLGGTIVGQVANPEYGLVPRPEDTLTEEAHIVLTLEEIIPINNRI